MMCVCVHQEGRGGGGWSYCYGLVNGVTVTIIGQRCSLLFSYRIKGGLSGTVAQKRKRKRKRKRGKEGKKETKD